MQRASRGAGAAPMQGTSPTKASLEEHFATKRPNQARPGTKES